jgi:hypothetical protein
MVIAGRGWRTYSPSSPAQDILASQQQRLSPCPIGAKSPLDSVWAANLSSR